MPASMSPVAEIRINGQETAYSVSLCPEARAAQAERLQEGRRGEVGGGGGGGGGTKRWSPARQPPSPPTLR